MRSHDKFTPRGIFAPRGKFAPGGKLMHINGVLVCLNSVFVLFCFVFFGFLEPLLYALSLPLGVNLPLWVNICPTLLNTPMGKWLRLYVF